MSGRHPSTKAGVAQSSSSKNLLWVVLVGLVALVVGVVVARSGGENAKNAIIFDNQNKDGSYPNVTSRIQILGLFSVVCVCVFFFFFIVLKTKTLESSGLAQLTVRFPSKLQARLLWRTGLAERTTSQRK